MQPPGAPVVFVHGLWLHADSWSPWVDLFREAGYAPVAPGWPGDSGTGEETRKAPDRSPATASTTSSVEVAFANLSPSSPAEVATDNATREPLLITAGGKDRTVPAAVSQSTLKRYRKSPAVTDQEEFPNRGHTLALDSRWLEVADTVLNWLKKHSL